MLTRPTQFLCGAAAMLCALSVSQGQVSPPAPAPLSSPMAMVHPAPAAETAPKPASSLTAPAAGKAGDNSLLLVQATAPTTAPLPATGPAPGTATTTTTTTTG